MNHVAKAIKAKLKTIDVQLLGNTPKLAEKALEKLLHDAKLKEDPDRIAVHVFDDYTVATCEYRNVGDKPTGEWWVSPSDFGGAS